jgi:hypothetical protein
MKGWGACEAEAKYCNNVCAKDEWAHRGRLSY